MMKIRYCRYSLFFLCFIQTAFSVYAQDQVEQMIKPLETWANTFPQEKMYVHTDKPYYMAGDTIWFKNYTVIGARHQLSSLSGAVYVDLISTTDSVVSSLKLPLMAGMAKGSMALPVELKPGNYRLRAYTQWMRNVGSDYFYDRTVYIGAISPYGTEAKASLQFDTENAEKPKGMQVVFLDAKGGSLADKSVEYVVRTGGELFSSRKAKTNEQGVLQIPLNEKDLQDSAATFIVTELSLDKKQTVSHIFPVTLKYKEVDVQFFPESGNLVGGLPTRVAFKAVGTDGLGVAVKGILIDQDKVALAEFNSVHLGMGQFSFTPEAGKKYEAQMTLPDGSVKMYPLPEVRTSGYVLSAYPQLGSDTVMLRILCSADKLKQPVSLVAQVDGEVFYAADMDLHRSVNSMYVPLQQRVSGVVQLTLFHGGKPVNERIFYMEQADTLDIDLEGIQGLYTPRSEASIELAVKNSEGQPVAGNFSLSVIDENQVPTKEEEETSIFSQLLLQSSLKGYIEKPNYYFTAITDEKRDYLDLLMMTQGYRRFVWSELLASKEVKAAYPAEKMVSSITGKLLTLRSGKPVPNGKITLFSVAGNIALDTTTDTEGRFVFDDLLLTDSIKFTIQGRTEKGSDKVELLLDGIPSLGVTRNKNAADFALNVNQQLHTYFENTKKNDDALAALGLESRLIRLSEVVVTAKVEKKLPVSYNMNGAGRADQIIASNELGTCPTLRMCLEGRLNGVVFRTEQTMIGPVAFPTSSRGGKMLLVIDGRQLRFDSDGDLMDLVGIFEQNLIDPAQILNIEVLRSPSLTNIYGAGAQAGVILINTKGWSPSERKDYSAQLYAPKGFSAVREFYSPKYGVSERLDALADQRSTVYWNPVISVNKEGKAAVNYFNTGNPASYRVVVEGIGADGQLGRKVIRYQVK